MADSKKQLFLEGVDYDEVIAVGVDLFVQPAQSNDSVAAIIPSQGKFFVALI